MPKQPPSTIENGASNIILVPDVFGITSSIIKLSKELNADAIVDSYDGVDIEFNSEAEAYSYFMTHVGHDAYLTKLSDAIQTAKTSITLVGFSVGATAIWRLSESFSSNTIKRAICYYGSQIRNYSKIDPTFEIELVFPKNEPHFDVCELQANLSRKENVTTTQVNCLHGFMNPRSHNFNKIAYQNQVERLCSIVK